MKPLAIPFGLGEPVAIPFDIASPRAWEEDVGRAGESGG